jgi:glycogen debranching enzyme
MPCVGVNEPRFQATNYWRGPTWININWLVALGLDCYGLTTQAKHIREMSLKMVGMSPYPREYYNALTGGGLGAENYMWTGAIDIIIANELDGRTAVGDVLYSALSCPAS